jgi:hypothetical protein
MSGLDITVSWLNTEVEQREDERGEAGYKTYSWPEPINSVG